MKRLGIAGAVTCLMLAMGTAPAASAQGPQEAETAVRAVAAELRRSWDARDNEAWLNCFAATPEGLFVSGGTSHTVETMRALNRRLWADRTNESWKNEAVQVIVLGDDTALLLITYTGRYTLPTGVTWEFTASSFSTSLVRKIGGAWKIVSHHNSGAGRQVTR